MNNTEQQQPEDNSDLIAGYANEMRQMDIAYAQSGIRKARNTLFFAGGMLFVSEMLVIFRQGYTFTGYLLLIALVEGGLFVALGLWTRKKPYSAVIGGLIAFIGVILFAVAVHAATDGLSGAFSALTAGLILKICILVALVKALGDAKTVQDAQKKVF